jgi:prolipoprotein diacylglyceryltransferase
MLPILQIGPLAIQVPGLALLLGLWVGLGLAEKQARRLSAAPGAEATGANRLTGDHPYNLALLALVAGLVGARLIYAGRYLEAYRADPLGLVALNPATLAIPEGVVVAGLAAVIYGARRRVPWRPALDALAPLAAVMGVAFALAHLASGDAFGAPTRVPWRIFLWDEYRHPSQVYELMAALAVLAAWWRLVRPPVPAVAGGAGRQFLVVVALMAAARMFLEAFRGDSVLVLGGLRAAQVAAWAVLAVCVWGLMRPAQVPGATR